MLNELQTLYPYVKKIRLKNPTLKVLDYMSIANGRLRYTNLNTEVSIKVDSKINTLVPLNIIEKILKSKPKTFNVEVEHHDENEDGYYRAADTVFIKYDNKTVKVNNSVVSEEYPKSTDTGFSSTSTSEWNANIFSILKEQLNFVTKDELRPALMGIRIYQDDTDKLKIAATDGHRLNYYKNIPCISNKSYEVTINTEVVPLFGIKNENVRVFYKEYMLKFVTNDGVIIVSRLIDEPYPDVDVVIPKEYEYGLMVDKKKFLKEIKEGLSFAHKETKQCVFRVEDSKLLLDVLNIDNNYEWHSIITPIVTVGDKYEDRIGFNLKYMETILKTLKGEDVNIKFNDSVSAFAIEDDENIVDGGTERNIILMPIRLSEDYEEEE